MQIDIVSLNRLWNPPSDLDAVVVIDVLRSFTTAAYAISGGARAIYLAEGPSAAFALWRQRPHATLIGALGGGRPVPGFDYGNSPSAILAANLRDEDIILSTAAGVRGLLRFASLPLVFGGALCTASATATALLAYRVRHVALIVTGEWVDRDGDEDIACAELIKALLLDHSVDHAEAVRRVRQSDFGRRFGAADQPHLPMSDLDCASAVDCFDFALQLKRADTSNGLKLVRSSSAGFPHAGC